MAIKNISIIGAGVGGLAAAARLAKHGHNVSVFEKLPRCGGRANIIEVRGFKFDTGPSFVLMPDFYSEVFDYCGENINSYLKFRALDISYSIFYADNKRLNIYRDNARTREGLEKIEPGAAARYDDFLTETQDIYSNIRQLLYKCFTVDDIKDYRYWPLLFKLKPWKTYWSLAKKYFKSEHLAYAFTFEAMFVGISPFKAPAFYSIITYADHVQKIYHPMGGMYQIPLALEKMAKKHGAKIFYNEHIRTVNRSDKGWSVEGNNGVIDCDDVVINADYAYARQSLLEEKLPDYEYSSSTLIFYWGLKKKVEGLEHHNIFFASDVRKNMAQIFYLKEFSQDPSFYIHVPTVTDLFLAPEGKDIIYVLVPVPNMQNCREDAAAFEGIVKRAVLKRVKEQAGVDIEPLIEVEHKFYPRDFYGQYNILHGATFGLAHSLKQSAFWRPPNHQRNAKGLYFVGASTQPGGGLPPVIAGSRIVADMITASR